MGPPGPSGHSARSAAVLDGHHPDIAADRHPADALEQHLVADLRRTGGVAGDLDRDGQRRRPGRHRQQLAAALLVALRVEHGRPDLPRAARPGHGQRNLDGAGGRAPGHGHVARVDPGQPRCGRGGQPGSPAPGVHQPDPPGGRPGGELDRGDPVEVDPRPVRTGQRQPDRPGLQRAGGAFLVEAEQFGLAERGGGPGRVAQAHPDRGGAVQPGPGGQSQLQGGRRGQRGGGRQGDGGAAAGLGPGRPDHQPVRIVQGPGERQEVRAGRAVERGAGQAAAGPVELPADPCRHPAGAGHRGARRRQQDVAAPAAEGVAEHPDRAGRRGPHRAAVQQRQCRGIAAQQHGGRRGQVGRGDLALRRRADPGVAGQLGRAHRVGVVGPVVPGRCGRGAGRPLAVEVVVVRADHLDRAAQHRVGPRPGQVAGRVQVLLALQVVDVTVAAGQQHHRRDARGRVAAVRGRGDVHQPADRPALGRPGGRVQGDPVHPLAAAAVPDQQQLRQVGPGDGVDRGRGRGLGRSGRRPAGPDGQVVLDQGGPGRGAGVGQQGVLSVDPVGGDRDRDVALGGEQVLLLGVAAVARHRRPAGRAGPGRAAPAAGPAGGAAGVPAVQEQHQRAGAGSPGRADHQGMHLDRLGQAGDGQVGQGVLGARGGVSTAGAGVGGQRRVGPGLGQQVAGADRGGARGLGPHGPVEALPGRADLQLLRLGRGEVGRDGEPAAVRADRDRLQDPGAGPDLDPGAARPDRFGGGPGQGVAGAAPAVGQWFRVRGPCRRRAGGSDDQECGRGQSQPSAVRVCGSVHARRLPVSGLGGDALWPC